MSRDASLPSGSYHRSMQVNRRTVLRQFGLHGLAASVALPMLDIMRPVQASQGAERPVRLAWVFFPNGTNAERWEPKGSGTQWELSPTLEPLADCRNDFNVLKGLAQVNAQSLGDGPGDHARSAAAYLTGAHPFKTAGSKIRVGRSADQIAADSYGRQTRLGIDRTRYRRGDAMQARATQAMRVLTLTISPGGANRSRQAKRSNLHGPSIGFLESLVGRMRKNRGSSRAFSISSLTNASTWSARSEPMIRESSTSTSPVCENSSNAFRGSQLRPSCPKERKLRPKNPATRPNTFGSCTT